MILRSTIGYVKKGRSTGKTTSFEWRGNEEAGIFRDENESNLTLSRFMKIVFLTFTNCREFNKYIYLFCKDGLHESEWVQTA